jgi:hypothetical protein
MKTYWAELLNSYSSPDINGVINSRSMRWVGHVVRVGEMRNTRKILVGKAERKRTLWRDLDVDEMIILKWALNK